VRRIQSGNDENLPQVETVSTEQFNKIYQEGYKAGHAAALSKLAKDGINDAYEKQMRVYNDAARQSNVSGQMGQANGYSHFGGLYNSIFG